MFFNLLGAAYSHAQRADPIAKTVTPLVLLGLLAASWALRPASRALPRAPSTDSGSALRGAELASAQS